MTNGGMGGRRSGLGAGTLWMQGTGAIQVAAITLLFIPLGQPRHREGTSLTHGLGVSCVPLEKDSSHSTLVWPHVWF